MKPHETRVKGELQEMEARAEALRVFVNLNPAFKELGEEESELVVKQLETMEFYTQILRNRIALFE